MYNTENVGNNIPEPLRKIVKTILKYIKPIIVGILLLIVALSSFFQVQPEELGVITRFGEYIRTVDPGLNAKIPFAETVYKVPVERQQKEEFGFRTTDTRSLRTGYSKDGT